MGSSSARHHRENEPISPLAHVSMGKERWAAVVSSLKMEAEGCACELIRLVTSWGPRSLRPPWPLGNHYALRLSNTLLDPNLTGFEPVGITLFRGGGGGGW